MKNLVKINSLQIENIKRVRAVELVPSENGLTIIGGKNKQGKTSILDSIAYALGGEKYKQEKNGEAGNKTDPYLKIELSNGIIVERKGKNSALKVTDSKGMKGGQALLNEFVSQFALDLPKFLNASEKEKADILLQIIGVGNELKELEELEKALYSDRAYANKVADKKVKYAEQLEEYKDVPSEKISTSELLEKYQLAVDHNNANKAKKIELGVLEDVGVAKNAEIEQARIKTEELQRALEEAKKSLENLQSEQVKNKIEYKTKLAEVKALVDIDTSDLMEQMNNVEAINNKVEANKLKFAAEKEANELLRVAGNIDKSLKDTRLRKVNLLTGADLPLEDLSIKNGELVYKGFSWDNMSGAEQLVVATAIVRKLNTECGFVLMDKLEQFDTDTLKEFGKWLEKENLQVIATKVTTEAKDCSIIIEDGIVKEGE